VAKESNNLRKPSFQGRRASSSDAKKVFGPNRALVDAQLLTGDRKAYSGCPVWTVFDYWRKFF
jgi:hypothetical protein